MKVVQNQKTIIRRHRFINALVMLILALVVVRFFNERPAYTDAFYHYNAAVRLASGDGLVDDYLWTFIAAPDSLPAPSHLYWMPLTSIVSAMGMSITGVGYLGAQIGLMLALWGASMLAFWLGLRLTGRIVLAWFASILLVCGGFLLRMWGITDTFALYAFVGSAALVSMGLGLTMPRRRWLWWALAGVFAALGHLTRSDGLLLLVVGVISLLWPTRITSIDWRHRLQCLAIFLVMYALVMMPWFIRNLTTIGTILPVGGAQAIWYTEYNDLFNYPPDANPQTFFASGLGDILASRMEGLSAAFQNLLAIEGYIFLTPFMLYALWVRRRDPFLRPMIWFALGLHAAFALVFTYPGIRGGLLHGLTALMPFWVALSFDGLQRVIAWAAQRLPHWNQQKATVMFSLMLTLVAVVLGLALGLPRRVLATNSRPQLYDVMSEIVAPGQRVMINDPSQLYYYTGIGGVTLPNEPPDTLLSLAETYNIDYLVVEYSMAGEDWALYVPVPFIFDLDDPPAYLTPMDVDLEGARIYAINP